MFSFAKRFVDRLEGNQENNAPDSYFKSTLQLNNKGYGLRVLNVKPHSLAHEAGLESWFDFIIRINHHDLPMAYPALSTYAYSINEDGTINYGGNATQEQASMVNFDLLNQEIQNISQNEHSTKELILDVWSAKGGIIRQIVLPLKPNDDSSTQTSENPDIKSLIPATLEQTGLTLQSQHVNTASYVWRILNTHPGSPAFLAQLVPYSDYIIGCDSAFPDDPYGKGLLSQGGEALLSKTILRYYNHNFEKTHDDAVPITLYVYNHDYDVLRPVTVNLTRAWGNGQNRGILGCDVGYGLLHRVPEVVGKFDLETIVDDVLFEDELAVGYRLDQPQGTFQQQQQQPYLTSESPETSGQLFTPMAAGSTPAPPPPRAGAAKKKKASRPNAMNDLSEYMNEELQKSKETDLQGQPKTSDSSSPPPPPPPAKSGA